jgi:S-adenosylmethionine-dependent methyltransferase
MKRFLRRLAYASLVPASLSRNQRLLTDSQLKELEQALRRNYFSQPLNYFAVSPEAYLATEDGSADLSNHMLGRLSTDRERVIPWLNDAKALKGTRVLEIGCGTGASTVALTEQGAIVTAVDVNAGNVEAARARLDLYGLSADFVVANATELHQRFSPGSFDLIVFFATLEHLTYGERMTAMRGTWSMLKGGQLWAVVETPNRLWWFDDHTSCLPFYHWLPDELALDYAPYSERQFMKEYRDAPRNEATSLDLARRGRGVSFHEFDLTMGRDVNVVSALDPYLRRKNSVIRARWLASADRKACAFLRSRGPLVHEGFYQPYLDLIIAK